MGQEEIIKQLIEEADASDFRCTGCNQGSCVCEVGEPNGF